MTWITTILGWLTGDALKVFAEIYAKNKDSKVESERIEAEWAKAKLDAMLQVRLATAGFWEMRLITALIAGCFTLHLVLVTLDTCFQFSWSIPAFPQPFAEWEGAILLSFFGLQAGVTSIRGIAGAIASRKK